MITKLGTHYGGWMIELDWVNSESVVYSAGVGEDISFDLALIELTGCSIHAFDPTPRSIEWLSRQVLPPTFTAHGFGFASTDGARDFYPPKNREWVSHSVFAEGHREGAAVRVPFKRLSTTMRELGHAAIDLLKMDIEGAEYDVFEEIVQMPVPITQIAVELHQVAGHDLPGVIATLSRSGYVVAAVDGDNHLFHRGP